MTMFISFHKKYFINMARSIHREGMIMRRQGDYAGAYCNFMQSKILINRARGV